MPTPYTPGPWRADLHTNRLASIPVIAAASTGKGRDKASAGSVIAAVRTKFGGIRVTKASHDEGCANAHLIAAAPDLLEALQGVIEWDRSFSGSAAFAAAMHAARSAIAKATGHE